MPSLKSGQIFRERIIITVSSKHNVLIVAGIITKDDLESYTAAVKDALTIDLSGGDYRVISPPPPSSGAVILLILNILDGKNSFLIHVNVLKLLLIVKKNYNNVGSVRQLRVRIRARCCGKSKREHRMRDYQESLSL